MDNAVHDVFFAGEDVDIEIRRKLATLDRPPAQLVDRLLREARPTPDDAAAVRALARELLSDGQDEERVEYVRHAIRVAASAVRRGGATRNDIVLALLHNVYELPWFDGADLERRHLPAHRHGLLALLDTDRSRERDPSYLDAFYDAIAAHSDLLVLKALDKLDNALSYVLWDLDDHHRDVVIDVLCPRVRPVDPGLADYLAGVARYVARPDVRERFR